MSRVLSGLAGLALMAAVLGAMLLATVPADRGRDEINLLTIHELPLANGGVLTQPVPLQRAAPYDVLLPYRWRESHPARVEVVVSTQDGGVLTRKVESLDNSRAPYLVQPVGDGSFWQRETAAFHAIRLLGSARGTVLLRLTRVDQEPGTLILFASDRLPPMTTQVAGRHPDTRPGLVEQPMEYLDVQTEYGAPVPAIAKVPVYVSRLHSFAPAWLPFPLPELLLALIAAAGIYLYVVLLFSRPRSR